MEEIYANVDYVKPVGLRPSTNQTSRSGSDRRFLGAVVLLLGLLSFVLLAGLIGLGVHHRDSAAEHLAVRENLTERLQASENKTSSLSREIERLQTLSNRDRDSAAEHLAVRENLTERLQASENKTSSLSREIERLQTLSNRVKTCPDGWKRFESTCYLVSVETASWERGWQDCTSRGADLVIVDRAEEQTFLTIILEQDTWIGLTDRDQEGSWKWSDGTPLTLAFWRTGQPDNGGGHPQIGEEDCATSSPYRGTGKNWNDLPCDASKPWICEKNAN
ncbi:C-type lectin domain family 4 member E isoform X6 [Scophthalmus maximus]|uniref:C-type lectin domain family 4 member E isoform X5 n=1 Tax=Scophthalmus maximus TaxID=52904 RepID=UPI001FA877B4|nr:C-type lectin domain family 4 member E isoform X5 [Scophthalmus maximus]XP_047193437.1 C-type lectin domain family 4 member E isoform X6 [Scophthalmus maximus]